LPDVQIDVMGHEMMGQSADIKNGTLILTIRTGIPFFKNVLDWSASEKGLQTGLRIR